MLINSSDISGLTHSANGYKKVTFLQQKMRYILSQGTGVYIYIHNVGQDTHTCSTWGHNGGGVPMHLMRLAVPICFK